jgi:hypothetical protein
MICRLNGTERRVTEDKEVERMDDHGLGSRVEMVLFTVFSNPWINSRISLRISSEGMVLTNPYRVEQRSDVPCLHHQVSPFIKVTSKSRTI